MASGRLFAVDLAAATDTNPYTAPSGKTAAFSVSFCNRNTLPVLVRLALCATSSPGVAEYVEYEVSIAARGVLERTGLVLGAGQNLVVRSDTANVSCVGYGFED